MQLGEVIRSLRGAAGMSQRALAESLGISPSYMSLIEANRREPALPLLRSLAAALGAPSALLIAVALVDEGESRESAMQREVVQQLVDAVRWGAIADRARPRLDGPAGAKARVSKGRKP